MGNQARIRGLCRAQLCVDDILGADAIIFHTCGAGDVGQRLKRGTRGTVFAQHTVIGDNADTARAQQTKPRKAVVFQGGWDQGGVEEEGVLFLSVIPRLRPLHHQL